MATAQKYEKLISQERKNRYFSEDFKRKKVREIERNITSIAEICREYQVSNTAVYKWIYKYSNMRKKGVKQVVEARSDTRKIQQLKEQLKELERVIGQKQLLIDFHQKVIELAEKEYNIDIKKKFGEKPFSGTGITGSNTPIK
ncbi:MAG: transposase [Bacteroidales bacterium]|nr:transposase [Bacteroidales bacterium]